MRSIRIPIFPTIALALTLLVGIAAASDVTTKSFEAKKRVRINTVSGDVELGKSTTGKIEVEVTNRYSPRDSFRPEFDERGQSLRLKERILDSNSGNARWVVLVPDGTEVDFNTASGDMRIKDLSGEFGAETASGDVELIGCSGEYDFRTASGDIQALKCRGVFEVSTASGDIDLEQCQGVFELSTASGRIDADQTTLDDASDFSTASGRVAVHLAAAPEHDLSLSTASGSATLDSGGNEIRGAFEFVAKARKGHISSPIDFDDEETFNRWGDKYVRKTFTRGADLPRISISTASGRATLEEG